ncbi:hypothetical protein [Streptomyces sulphureus]|uniref:hypothetical protein n=1 Tax=Streptomyces sulphureus TaxID=47758 RepID=UPI00037EF2D9|nr:hypothetical protein [Streptomyces sulphureus]
MSPPPHRRPEAEASRADTGDHWATWQVRAKVLGIARTLTSATRLQDVLTLLRRPDGIELYYTVNEGSRFSAGLHEYLASLVEPERVLPWETAVAMDRAGEFQLAVACTVNSSMHSLTSPLVVLPHGAGYNRLVPETTGDAEAPAGLSRGELLHAGRLVPHRIALSHEEQLTRLARSCPEALPHAVDVGDPCFERMLRSLELRDRYRAQLGAVDGRRLVAVNSTWSTHSLLGRRPDLPLRLLASLPADEFRVALVLHPNVWAHHGKAGVLDQLAEALDAGLLVVPPQAGWRAALVAADWIVGDHGSTSFYGAALGRTTLLAADGLAELDPASPTAEFARTAPPLDPDGDLHAQLLDAEEHFTTEDLRSVTDRSLSHRNDAARRVRDLLYAELAPYGVLPSAAPRLPPVEEPEPRRGLDPSCFAVYARTEPGGAVAVRRHVYVPRQGLEECDFYAVTAEETSGHRGTAPVCARAHVSAELPAGDWLEKQAAAYPLLDVGVADLGEGLHLVRLRGGERLEAWVPRQPGEARPAIDPLLLGSALYAVLLEAAAELPEELPPGEGERRVFRADTLGEEIVVRTGRRRVAVQLVRV